MNKKFSKPFSTDKISRDLKWREDISDHQRTLSKKLLPIAESIDYCPICTSKDRELFVEIFGYHYCECSSCQHLYLEQMPTAEQLRSLYSQGDAHSACQGQAYIGEEIFKTRVEAISRPKFDFVKQSIGDLKGRWVDIGCGTGELLSIAKAHGMSTMGIDLDPNELEFASQQGIDVAQFEIDDIPAQNLKGASVVSMLNLLEHLVDPTAKLQSIIDKVDGDFHLVIEVPRHPSLSSLVAQLAPNLAYRHIYPPDHVNLFSDQSLEIMLKKLGFEVQAQWDFGQGFEDLYWAMQDLEGRKLDQRILKSLQPAINSMQAAVDEAQLADIMFVVAWRKKS